MRELRYSVAHTLTGRYVNGVHMRVMLVLSAIAFSALGASVGDAKLNISEGRFEQGKSELELLASKGDAEAQYELGRLYFGSSDMEQDYSKGIPLLRSSAGQGYPVAQVDLAELYLYGIGVLQDFKAAYMWANIGTHNGNKRGEDVRNQAGKLLTREDISKAQDLSRFCLKSGYVDCGDY